MARGVNKVILIGNLGADPGKRVVLGDRSICNVTIATTDSWKDKASGELQERTEWHRVVFFDRLAEIVDQYLRKGSKVYVEGSLRTRKWQDKDGYDRYTTEIVAQEMQMLDGRKDGDSPRSNDRGDTRDTRSDTRRERPKAQHDAPPAPDFDDDIPF